MEPELIRSSDYIYSFTLNLTKRDIVELLRFYFDVGWISYEDYDRIHDFIWTLKIEMDMLYPKWEPKDLARICKELKGESQ